MSASLTSKIDQMVKSNPVMIFMKGTPEFPQCGFSHKAVKVLEAAGVAKPAAFDVLSDDAMWEALEEYTKWPTVPQIFVNGKFVGGCDIVTEMYEKGELQELLQG